MKEEKEKNMTPIFIKDLGMRYPKEASKKRYRYGLYQCQYCDKEFEAHIQSIKTGNTRSCGCLSKRYKNPHSYYGHRLYATWNGMKARCYNPKHNNYKNYGERGIKVCDRWLDINNFIEDMYPSYQKGLTLDRIEVDGNYELDNCRWLDYSTQMHNTRDIRSTNTSGFRGVTWHKKDKRWQSRIKVQYTEIYLGSFKTALEAAKAYERYVRLNNLEHNFTPALTEEEIKTLSGLNNE